MGLDQKVAVVTGAAQGIGAAIAEELAAEGCSVALVDHAANQIIDEAAGRVAARGVRSMVLKADVTDFDAAGLTLDKVAEELGALDILVCCAGITRDAVSWKMTEDEFDSVIDVNLKGVFNYNRAAALHFRKRGWGRIVNIASINGMRGKFGQANYAASKGGVIALSKSMARELGKSSVTVNCVAPGLVMTEMAADIPAEFLDTARSETVTGRLAETEDVAKVVTFLCSEAARHVTGEVIRVDGGQYI
ncbi:beta-ketoacyl-ACP reductase [bacterium]|nr:MAG: beta-ketoacyl-ACP reductase [bacterium]RKZ15256.1 MAG: beta-ketoacyl-ACP reductase [bacterium]